MQHYANSPTRHSSCPKLEPLFHALLHQQGQAQVHVLHVRGQKASMH